MFRLNKEAKEIFIYGPIGEQWMGRVDSGMVISALDEMAGEDIRIRLNTPGGNVDEGIAIFNAIKRHEGSVTMVADSIAASMGSYLLQASERRVVASNAMVMIHDPWTIALGNATELRKAADMLEKYAARMVPDYASRSGKTDDEVKQIMSEETWYTGQEAIDAGWADELGEENKIMPETDGLEAIARKIPGSLFKHRDKLRAELDSKHQFPRLAMIQQKIKDLKEQSV